MATGFVKKWIGRLGYGFIQADLGGREFYFRCDEPDIQIGDRVSFDEHVDKGRDRIWASNVRIIQRAPKKPKLLRRTGTAKKDINATSRFTFIADDHGAPDAFLDARVAERCGVRIDAGDRVVYELDPTPPRPGYGPRASSVSLA